MIWPETLDYRLYPLSSPGSRLGLRYGGRRFGWLWAGAFCNHHATPIVAPFARLEGLHSPQLACQPGSCVMSGEDAQASFHFAGEDSLRIALNVPPGTRCHFASLKFRSVSGEQVLCEDAPGWWLALEAPHGSLVPGHSGVTLTTISGATSIGCGLGDSPDGALERASAAARLSEAEAQAAARAPFESFFRRVPEIEHADPAIRRLYAECWWALCNNMVSPRGLITRRAAYPDRVYHSAIWLWDTCFHAVALREADPELARDQLRVLLDNQQPSGLVPDVIRDDSLYAEHTKPPLIAWAAWKIHRAAPSLDFLNEVYPKCCRLDDWWMAVRDCNRNGLPGYEHPFSAGIDDSPAFNGLDTAWPEAELEAPDLAAYLYGGRLALADMAFALGRESEAEAWRARAAELARNAVRSYFDRADQFFYARLDGRPVRVRIPHWLLAARLLPREEAQRVLHRWLVESPCFEEQWLLATVAHDEPSYDPVRWRGAIWLNINLLVAETAAWAGLPDVADHIAERSLDLVARRPGLWEHFDAASGEGGGPPSFGWTAACCIEFALGRQREAT